MNTDSVSSAVESSNSYGSGLSHQGIGDSLKVCADAPGTRCGDTRHPGRCPHRRFRGFGVWCRTRHVLRLINTGLLYPHIAASSAACGLQPHCSRTASDWRSCVMLPRVIQGGMGVGVSSRTLAREVASLGQLGVVSGIALDTILIRRLGLGDRGGQMRRAMAAFLAPEIAQRVIARYFRPERPVGCAADGAERRDGRVPNRR